RLGAWLGVTDPALPARLESILRRLGLPTFTPEGLERDALLAAFAADKKRREGRVSFVLPCPGGVDLLTGLDPERALAALMAEPVMAP
ncbi:MAG TPA: hypothetical protein VF972_07415, partial [Actinomycetota bacterium]